MHVSPLSGGLPFRLSPCPIKKVLEEMLHLPALEITIKHRDATSWFEGYYLEASIDISLTFGTLPLLFSVVALIIFR